MAKKSKLTRDEFVTLIQNMTEDQFSDFAKDHNREIHSMSLWSKGENYEAKAAYAITQAIIDQMNIIDEIEGWISENPGNVAAQEQLAIEQNKLEYLIDDIENKADSFGAVYKMMQKEADKFYFMSDLFKEKAQAVERRIDAFKRRLTILFQALNVDKIKGTFFTISMGRPTYSVMVNEFSDEQMHALPKEYVKQTLTINKTAVKEALLNGEKLPWASLAQKTGITIR